MSEFSRCAVVVALGGQSGCRSLLSTLTSLMQGWASEPDWHVIVTAPEDPDLRELTARFQGDLEIRWGESDVRSVQREREMLGETVQVVIAGDAVEDVLTGALRIPLVDRQAYDIDGNREASLSSQQPDTDGSGRLSWVHDFDPEVRRQVVVFTNLSVGDVLACRAARKIAWLVESPDVYPETAVFVEEHQALFDLVISSDAALVRRLPRAVLVPVGGSWIPTSDQKIHQKSRWCSMIASQKRLLEGHRLRHEIIPMLDGVDLFGRGAAGYGEVANKADALRDYCYSLAIENCRRDTYFSEKLIDCFRTGTIPIYWGTAEVSSIFNPRGILFFNGTSDVAEVLAQATPEYYRDNLDAVMENFHIASDWRVVEDRLADIIEPYVL